ncbi:MAG: UTP--glucose-1-phosphate uridylyltransferase [Candidatus Omnitrophota bacterium]
MLKNLRTIKKFGFLSLFFLFVAAGNTYAENPCLRVPINQDTHKRVDSAAIRLQGGGVPISATGAHDKVIDEIRKLIKNGKAWALFEDREPRVNGDKKIIKYTTKDPVINNFLLAIIEKRYFLPKGFEIVILDANTPKSTRGVGIELDVMLHPGHTREQSYLTLELLRELAHTYDRLDSEYKRDFITVVMEGFSHEAKHVEFGHLLEQRLPADLERIVDAQAPSYRARELFRVIYLKQKIKDKNIQPDMSAFFKGLHESKNKATHLFAYQHLTPEQHLRIADKLAPAVKTQQVRPGHLRIDTILAQHHIGHVLNLELKQKENANSQICQEALRLLGERNLIDRGPETRKPYPLWKFVRELIIQDKFAFMQNISGSNILLSDLKQLEEWRHGTQIRTGDSVRYPMPGETMAIALTKENAILRINSIPDTRLSAELKKGIISRLRTNDDSYIVIKHEDLMTIGNALKYKAASSTSAAGAGTRFAVVIGFNEDGKPIFHDAAKGVLKLEIDGGRSFIEMFLAQAALINKENNLVGERLPCIIYTSHITDEQVKKELSRIGYVAIEPNSLSKYLVHYRHKNPNYSDITVVRLQKTNLLDVHNADFLTNIDFDADWKELHWPHGHDSPIVDLITTGIAYELYQKGKIYVDISNIDNRAAGADPVILAIMELTKTPLANEITLKPKGERGGGAPVHFKKPLFKKHTAGNLERPNMGKAMQSNLTADDTAKYLPHKNTANNCVNIIEYVRQAFLGQSATEEDAANLLKAFYDAREDEEKKAELKFMFLEMQYRIKDEAMFIELSKRFPAVQIGTLLGFHTWLVDNLFLEVHQGKEAREFTRFEEQKENTVNLRNIVTHLEEMLWAALQQEGAEIRGLNKEVAIKLLTKQSKVGGLKVGDVPGNIDIGEVAELSAAVKKISELTIEDISKTEYPWLRYAIDSLKPKTGIKLIDFYNMAYEIYRIQLESLKRIESKGGRYYADQIKPELITAGTPTVTSL